MRKDTRITSVIEPTVEDMGFRLVRAQMSGTARPILQIMAEPAGGGQMTVENCADLSRALSAFLDVEDPIGGAYVLEVSSPGVDRPLTRPEDFDTYRGFDARVDLEEAIDGVKRFRGTLGGRDAEGNIIIGGGDAPITVSYDQIRRAKLLLTDALLAAHADQAKATTAESDEG